MKKLILVVLFFAFAANVSAQLKVDATGNTRVIKNLYLGGSLISDTSTVPITLKVNGVLAGSTGTSGKTNVSFGYNALYSNTTGNQNTATGYQALYSNTTGGANIAGGYQALYFNTTGICNTAIGNSVLRNNTTGNINTAIGYLALSDNKTGSYNTAIGYAANPNTNNLNSTTAIGYGAITTSSNQVRIGNSSVSSIGGYVGWTNLSDGRAKKNIRTDVPGLAFINLLQPVTYHLDLDAVDGLLKIDRKKRPGEDELPQELIDIEKKGREAKEKQVQTGFVAQDVEKVAQSIGYDFSGVDVDETGIYGLRYAEFVVPLVKAVQELSEQNDRLQAQNDQLQAQVQLQNDQMQAQINELTELVSGLLGEGTESGALRSKNALEPASGLQDAASSGASLQQNIPNPFHQSTVIRYTLPPTGQQAQMVITGASGRVIRKIPLSAAEGTGSIT
ncbi:MAG: tail fiber domain-containing protein, partial [Dysgonamonadaceae bacterium]|nr:tail fiber domain-containing protein [Dysgonamonadaceae bacterium]